MNEGAEDCGAVCWIEKTATEAVCTEPEGHFELIGTKHHDKWEGWEWE